MQRKSFGMTWSFDSLFKFCGVWRLVSLCFTILRYLSIIFLRLSVLQLGGCKLSGTQSERVNCFVDLINKERACSRKLKCRITEFSLLKEKDSLTFQSLWTKLGRSKLKFYPHGRASHEIIQVRSAKNKADLTFTICPS